VLRQSFKTHLAIYLAVNLGLIGIWAASGGGYFWPIWPILGWGIGLGCHGAPLLGRSRSHARGPSRAVRERPTSVGEVLAGGVASPQAADSLLPAAPEPVP